MHIGFLKSGMAGHLMADVGLVRGVPVAAQIVGCAIGASCGVSWRDVADSAKCSHHRWSHKRCDRPA